MLDLNELNNKQKESVETLAGPVLMLAGAGSGKTKALTYRIANIIATGAAKSQNILAVTFTNKAASEMKERLHKLINSIGLPEQDLFWVGTFHSTCVKILRREAVNVGLSSNFVIYDSDDSLSLVKEVMAGLNMSTKEINPNTVQGLISSAKNELISPNEYMSLAQGYFQQVVAKIYPEYQKKLQEYSATDFDDLIMKTILLFRNNPTILEKYQDIFQYILVDEYQDTNHAQYSLIKMLSQKNQNLFVVGDEDQSIYKFRGSDIRNILNFEKDFPSAKLIKLEQNYRSSQNILNASNAVITKNTQRRDKHMWTQNSVGDLIDIYFAQDEKDETNYIVNRILAVHPQLKTRAYSDDYAYMNKAIQENKTFAVLYRTNAQSRAVEEGLIQNRIPYKLVGGTKFYERREVKDILSYLRVIANNKDNLSLFRIINTPRRAAGKKVLDELEIYANNFSCTIAEIVTGAISLNDKSKQSNDISNEIIEDNSDIVSDLPISSNENTDIWGNVIQKKSRKKTVTKNKVEDSKGVGDIKLSAPTENIINLFTRLKNISYELNISKFINHLLDEINYMEYLDDGTEDGKARIENIMELKSILYKYEELPPRDSLDKFLEDMALIEQEEIKNREKDKKKENNALVTLMSVHSAKGLEFTEVFIIGMEDGIFPHSRSLMDSDEMEEERRLCYVALTRAREKLHIIHAESRRYFGSIQSNPRSRFLDDIPDDITNMLQYEGSSSSSMFGGDDSFGYKPSNKGKYFKQRDFDDLDFEYSKPMTSSRASSSNKPSSNRLSQIMTKNVSSRSGSRNSKKSLDDMEGSIVSRKVLIDGEDSSFSDLNFDGWD
jgi:DNA helicase-2/ATP-dependent DNA helicase PcrA